MRINEVREEEHNGQVFRVLVGGTVSAKGRARPKGMRADRRPAYVTDHRVEGLLWLKPTNRYR